MPAKGRTGPAMAAVGSAMSAKAPTTYAATADVFLRFLSVIYLFAFTSLWVQLPGLFSSNGILPCGRVLDQLDQLETTVDIMKRHPTFVVLFSRHFGFDVDAVLECVVLCGVATSLAALSKGCGAIVMAAQYLLYLSVLHVGQTFLSFQWDTLLLEVGFAAVLVARPGLFATWRDRGCRSSPAQSSLFLVRFVLFKLMLMSGAVKIQADCPTWTNLTACHYHFATQCIPTPLAWFFAQLPGSWLKASVAATLWIELAAPALILVPVASVQTFAAAVQILLQGAIILTGNYNYFNLLTACLAVSLLDLGGRGRHGGAGSEAEAADNDPQHKDPPKPKTFLDVLDSEGPLGVAHHVAHRSTAVGYVCCAAFTAYTAWQMFEIDEAEGLRLTLTKRSLQRRIDSYLPPVLALYGIATVLAGLRDVAVAATSAARARGIASRALDALWKLAVLCSVLLVFTAGFVPLTKEICPKAAKKLWPAVERAHSLSSGFFVTAGYGLFRRMTGVGDEDGRGSLVLRPELEFQGSFDGERWTPYNFTYKPGDVSRPPPWVAPHQPRLDWQLWFSALSPNHDLWFVHFVYKLLLGEKAVLALMGSNPTFEDDPPKYVRVVKHHYNFTSFGSEGDKSRWWQRMEASLHLRPIRKDDESLLKILRDYGFRVRDAMETAEDWVSRGSAKPNEFLWDLWITRRFEIASTFYVLLLLPNLMGVLHRVIYNR